MEKNIETTCHNEYKMEQNDGVLRLLSGASIAGPVHAPRRTVLQVQLQASAAQTKQNAYGLKLPSHITSDLIAGRNLIY